jgi:ABC-type uncharacterized transport system substrate-binding protein
VYVLFDELPARRLGLLREVVPNADVVAFLVNPAFLSAGTQIQEVRAAAEKLGHRIQIVTAGSPAEIEAAFASMALGRVGALVVSTDVFFNSQRELIVALAAKYTSPAVYDQRVSAAARRPDELWNKAQEGLASWRLHGANSHRRKTGRLASGSFEYL